VFAQEGFQPTVGLRKDTAFYSADGERHMVKIDLLTGEVIWRAITPPRTRGAVCVLADGPLIWSIDERNAHVIDDASGKVASSLTLPPEIAPYMDIRGAVVCDVGVLCLAVKRQNAGASADVPPAALALLTCRDGAGSVSVVAKLDEATGLVSGMIVADNVVVVAAGNKVITVRGKGKVGQ
jgi:hypothetical protein